MKVSFHTLGCRLNQSETASMQNSFEANGYTVVGAQQPADIVVINTCTVTQGGDADTRRLVHKINRLTPHARIALVGCQAQVQKEKLASLANVRWIVGNQRKMDLARVLDEHPNPQTAQVITPAIERQPFTLPAAAIDRAHTRANLKIQDGCDFFCSFCEIPYARGRARSRVFDDIVLEARALTAAGHKELILTGINIGTYQYEAKQLLDVIGALECIEGLERVRISSIEPTTIPIELFDRMGQGKLCRYLHIPLQSGHNDVLTAMKRKYTVEQFNAFIGQARAKVPHICIGTDVIVGFPGETDRRFEATVDFLRGAPVDYIHVFSYSPRHMAKSRWMETMSPAVIARRSRVLRELSTRKRRLYNESLLGTVQTVLCEEYKDNCWVGLTDHYVRVKIKSGQDLHNCLVPVRLMSIDGQTVLGEIL
ncbi:MAG: tRNA (N(6)-L-threonylcarbamoyladenosine(37)-C(2))-methylthiotransferase MtaB [Candidatus Omnitrophica bacterium]|nr:tRNA (N(6)-L-threonylcarbamoyladenosine(37)-C(2))-methylthiotransferase MtaB [Candidatus Omnitrophota bacterium]